MSSGFALGNNRPQWAGWHFALPLLFVVLYGSGFVGAKLGLPDAGPFTFLALRFALASIIMVVIALAIKAPWPSTPKEWLHIAGAGFFGVGVFSAAAFSSIALGVPPAISALIVALNPIVVALAAGPLLGERTNYRQLLGLLLGFCGVYLVLRDRLGVDAGYTTAVLLSVLALLGLAAGNLYQKKHCTSMNLFTGGALQCCVCALAMSAGMTIFDEGPVHWTTEFMVAWFWMAIAVSIGAVSILYIMIHRAEVSRVASVFFLMPVSAAVIAYALFGQALTASAFLGMGVTVAGVMLAQRR